MCTQMDCLSCFVRQAVEAVGFCVADEARQASILRHLLADLAKADWSQTPVALSQRLHRAIRLETGVPDPYHELKQRMNRLALDMLPCLLNEARLEEDPLRAIVRLSVAGNLMDAGAKSGLAEEGVRAALCQSRLEPLRGTPGRMFEAAAQARRILFLADNAGEIVFDRPLIERLSAKKVTVAVRGAPVLNDATMEDARTAGLCDLVTVISNGSDAAGTIVEECSEEFRRVLDNSDLIVAKGQGNFESLQAPAKHRFFLLRVKCQHVSAQVNATVGDMVVYERHPGDR